MADRVVPGTVENPGSIREAVCVNTSKIFDSCRDKDCVDDMRVFPTAASQSYIENALSIRARSAELLYVDVCVEPVSFNRGYYTVDCSYFYRITAETFPAGQICTGLGVFDKRVMLFGSEAGVKSFSSGGGQPVCSPVELPSATVDAVDPILLTTRIADAERPLPAESEPRAVPAFIIAAFDEPLQLTDCSRRWYATIGQFSIIRLERSTQLLIPAYDYCMPDKECPGVFAEDDPCTLFGRIRFPVEEFFPPDSIGDSEEYRNMR